MAEFIRELIVEGTKEGLDAARARGQRLGRPPALTPEQIAYARDLLSRPDNSVASIARLLGVSRSTIYKHVPELRRGRLGLNANQSCDGPCAAAAELPCAHCALDRAADLPGLA